MYGISPQSAESDTFRVLNECRSFQRQSLQEVLTIGHRRNQRYRRKLQQLVQAQVRNVVGQVARILSQSASRVLEQALTHPITAWGLACNESMTTSSRSGCYMSSAFRYALESLIEGGGESAP
jgi:hypothetical protein